ncbi:MAG: carboxypeptidase-like regulatory domain-containing protein [Sphingobacteriaceae bacterium]|nr:carboxypeptidase-like regulatory domain-containing protein [Sphingobacteriaceae bacterium]
MKPIYSFLLSVALSFILQVNVFAQRTTVSGTVRDAVTKETLPNVSVFFKDTKIGTQTDVNGKYTLISPDPQSVLSFNYVGYRTVFKNIVPAATQEFDVAMVPDSRALDEVVIVGGKKVKYRNKDNPAVELIRQVIAHKEENRIKSYNTVSYRQYEKMLFSMSNVSDKFKNKRMFRNYQFLFQEQDSTLIGGKNLLPIYIQEKLADSYLSKNPEKSKTIIIGEKQVQFDSRYIDNKGLKTYFDRMYQDIDIYKNNISVISNEFLSPIADGAPSFYKFFITDTIKTQKPEVIELSFTPRNTNDMLFEGKIYVTNDSHYAVTGASFGVNKNINLNFVRALKIDLNFEPNDKGKYSLSKSNLLADFGIGKTKGIGFTGERSVTFKNYKFDTVLPDTIFQGKSTVVLADAAKKDDKFWENNRLDTISKNQLKIYSNIDTLQNLPSFKRTMKIVTLLFAGYQNLGPYEIGPVNTFYSFNNVEGLRLRVGGRTTPELSKRYYFENYLAYGIKDEKWKFFLSATYSLNNKSIYEFPQNYVRASFQRDTKIPGQELQFVQEDNFLLSFKRGVNDMLLYNDFYRLDYVREFENHFSYNLGFKKWSQTPAGGLNYLNSDNQLVNRLTTSEVSLQLRYAPNEKFYQGKIYRVPIPDRYPVFNLRYTAGLKGVLGGEYNYHNLLGSIDKRFYLSQLGYSDVTLEGSYIAGKVPFPLLDIHRANQTYAYQLNSYNLMNFLEFVSDHYVSINIDQNFNGFFFNKVPLLKKLKLREVVSFKALYGGLRNENNPNFQTGLYRLPVYENGAQRTYALGNQPYMEGSVGVGNIFKLLRVDLVKRFNYLNNPEVSEWGIRARVKFDF